MARKTVSLGLTTEVKIEDHLDINVSKDKGTLTIRVISPEGVSAGKALLQYLGKPDTDVSLIKHVVLDVANETNLQFLFFYLAAPAGIAPSKWVGAGVPADQRKDMSIQVNVYSTDAARQIPSLILNVADNQVGVMQTIITPVFKRDVMFNVIGTAEMIAYTKEELTTATNLGLSLMKNLISKADDKPVDLNTLEEKIKLFLEKHLRFTESLNPSPIASWPAHPLLTMKQYMWLETKFLAGKPIHVESDETAHLVLSGDSAILVDAGNKIICRFLQEFIENGTPALNSLRIAITHFHDDHVGFLVPLIMAAQRAEVEVFLYSSFDKKAGQLDGFLASDIDREVPPQGRLLDKITFVNLSALAQNTTAIVAGGSTSVITAVEPPPAIKHFISSHGYTIVSARSPSLTDPNRVLVFTGDINPQSPTQNVSEIMNGLKDYLNALVQKAEYIGNQKTYEIFIDLGHFMAHHSYPLIKQSLDEWEKTFFETHTGSVYYGHMKNNTGTIVKAGGEKLPEM